MRWLTRPLLELGYLVSGLFAGVVTATVTVTGLALSIGLMPAFLLGIPVFGAVVYVVHGLAVMERGRAALFLDVDLPGRPVRNAPGLNWLRRILLRARSPEFWKEAGVRRPAAADRRRLGRPRARLLGCRRSPVCCCRSTRSALPGDEAITWLDWSDRLEVGRRLRRRRPPAAARPGPHRRAGARASAPSPARCCPRATAMPCAPRSPSSPRPGPGWSTPRTPSGDGSSATCTTAHSSTSSRSR